MNSKVEANPINDIYDYKWLYGLPAHKKERKRQSPSLKNTLSPTETQAVRVLQVSLRLLTSATISVQFTKLPNNA